MADITTNVVDNTEETQTNSASNTEDTQATEPTTQDTTQTSNDAQDANTTTQQSDVDTQDTTQTSSDAQDANTTADQSDVEAQIAELYIATFERAPDAAGLQYWVEQHQKHGMSIDDIAKSFFDQKETQELYKDSDTEAFVDSVYEHVLDRKPDDNGKAYWAQELEKGNITKDEFILAVLNAAKEHEGDHKHLKDKTEVGLEFVQEKLNDPELAKEIIKQYKEIGDKEAVKEALHALVEEHKSKMKEKMGKDGKDVDEEFKFNKDDIEKLKELAHQKHLELKDKDENKMDNGSEKSKKDDMKGDDSEQSKKDDMDSNGSEQNKKDDMDSNGSEQNKKDDMNSNGSEQSKKDDMNSNDSEQKQNDDTSNEQAQQNKDNSNNSTDSGSTENTANSGDNDSAENNANSVDNDSAGNSGSTDNAANSEDNDSAGNSANSGDNDSAGNGASAESGGHSMGARSLSFEEHNDYIFNNNTNDDFLAYTSDEGDVTNTDDSVELITLHDISDMM